MLRIWLRKTCFDWTHEELVSVLRAFRHLEKCQCWMNEWMNVGLLGLFWLVRLWARSLLQNESGFLMGRFGHAMVLRGEKLVVVGGFNGVMIGSSFAYHFGQWVLFSFFYFFFYLKVFISSLFSFFSPKFFTFSFFYINENFLYFFSSYFVTLLLFLHCFLNSCCYL